MIRHVKEEYWETSDGAQHQTADAAKTHEILLLIVEALEAADVQAPNGMLPVARVVYNHPHLLIVRAQHNGGIK